MSRRVRSAFSRVINRSGRFGAGGDKRNRAIFKPERGKFVLGCCARRQGAGAREQVPGAFQHEASARLHVEDSPWRQSGAPLQEHRASLQENGTFRKEHGASRAKGAELRVSGATPRTSGSVLGVTCAESVASGAPFRESCAVSHESGAILFVPCAVLHAQDRILNGQSGTICARSCNICTERCPMNEDQAMALLAFDIEISNIFDLQPGEDLDKYAPFDISVAATAMHGGEERIWLTGDGTGRPALCIDALRANALLDYLEGKQQEGHAICAWNGLSFDLRWVGHVAGEPDKASRIAMQLYDPMFQFYKARGFPIGLAAVGKGMGIPTVKTMNAADAPKLWHAGRHQDVCDYVMGDARMTLEIVKAIHERKGITWITQRGDKRTEPIPELRTVAECISLPMPDQAWMTTPLPQEKFTHWLRYPR